jgi:maleylacetate reductase
MDPFTYSSAAVRVTFGEATISRIGDELQRLGKSRAFMLADAHHRDGAVRQVEEALGANLAGISLDAVMHTPVDVSERVTAMVTEIGADALIALGGGSTIGLAKAIAWRTGLPIIAIPTTYAGSEATSILGQSEGGRKTTLRDPRVRPLSILYDVNLTLGLPGPLSAASGLNAMAHAVEATYAADANPVTTLLALKGIVALARALPQIVAVPLNKAARSDALFGAWACGTCLDQVGMSLHHKLCHTLGGSFGLPHAETHAVILPHAAAFNAVAVSDVLGAAAAAMGASDIGVALFDLEQQLGIPTSLAALGLKESQLDEAAAIAVAEPYWNPRPFDRKDIRQILDDAWRGRRPSVQEKLS